MEGSTLAHVPNNPSNQSTQNSADTRGAYRSGTAARLSGVPVETLRVWERRYHVVAPPMSIGGHRLYSQADVRRLTLIKRLVDMGNPVGSIARLPTDALERMREAERVAVGSGALVKPLRMAVIGESLAARLSADDSRGSWYELVATCAYPRDAANVLHGAKADVLVVEAPTLQADAAESIAALKASSGASFAIVLYRFASARVIRSLREYGHGVLRSPAEAAELEMLCRASLRANLPRAESRVPVSAQGEAPARRIDDRMLERYARANPNLTCECPRHLAELLLSLTGFERYSAECESRNEVDASLHRELQRTAGHARALIEESMLMVARAEGLPLP